MSQLLTSKGVAARNFRSAVNVLRKELELDRNSYPEARENPYSLKIERTLLSIVRCFEKIANYMDGGTDDRQETQSRD